LLRVRQHPIIRRVSAFVVGLAIAASTVAFAVPCVSRDSVPETHGRMDHSSHATSHETHDAPAPDHHQQPATSHTCSLMVVCGSALASDAIAARPAFVDRERVADLRVTPIALSARQPEPPPPRA
jgi:hypothetical protein